MKRNYPKVVISKEGEKWLDKGQMWLYQNNVESVDESAKNGDIVDIVTQDQRYLERVFILNAVM